MSLDNKTFVAYWPTTRPGCQNRKCTCVNNRWIRSRNIRIITLTFDGLNECNLWRPQEEGGVELLYNSVHRKFNQLETRCGRESQHPAEGALRPPINQFGDQTSWREDAGLRNMSQRGWAPRPSVEQPRRTGKKRGFGQ